MLSKALLLAVVVRSASLALPHTFFQPDEFYQAFEPAYASVFGTGFLTWEWRDLPVPSNDSELNWWTTTIVGGRLRGWIWPGVFAAVYRLLHGLGLDGTDAIVIAPRVVGVAVAALTDYFTYKLAAKALGPGAAPAALFLSLTSLFHGHLLPRALSTSPETLLTTIALCYYPLSSRAVEKDAARQKAVSKPSNAAPADDAKNYAAMDTADGWDNVELPQQNLVLAAALAATSLCIRPTMAVFWFYIHMEQTVHTWRRAGASGLLCHFGATLLGGSTILVAATALDYYMVGRLTLPLVTFFYQNVVLNIASFYGATGLLYHVVQSLPILMFPVWFWWGQGFAAAMLPRRMLPRRLASLSIPAPLSTLARAITFTIAVFSLSPHSEWRFLHPLLPQLLLFVIPPLMRQYAPTAFECRQFAQAVRQYCRLPRLAFYLIAVAPLAPYLYLNIFHGAGQVEVANALRRGDFGTVDKLVVLMPCHSIPWASHLGHVEGWFLTCQPPLAGVPQDQHWTQQDSFYSAPVTYLHEVFPLAPGTDSSPNTTVRFPSHILLFGSLLDVQQQMEPGGRVSVRNALVSHHYHEEGHLENGFDVAQDDEKRRGGVRVWVRQTPGS